VVTSLRFVPLMLCSSACLLDFCLFCWPRISTLLALFLMACLHWILRYTRLEIWRKIGLSAHCCLLAQRYALVVVHATVGLDWIGLPLGNKIEKIDRGQVWASKGMTPQSAFLRGYDPCPTLHEVPYAPQCIPRTTSRSDRFSRFRTTPARAQRHTHTDRLTTLQR